MKINTSKATCALLGGKECTHPDPSEPRKETPMTEAAQRIYEEARKLAHGQEGWDAFYALLVHELVERERLALENAAKVAEEFDPGFKFLPPGRASRDALAKIAASIRALCANGGDSGRGEA